MAYDVFMSPHGRQLSSPRLSRETIDTFRARAPFAREAVRIRETYLSQPEVDGEIFGTHWGREFFDTIAARIGSGEPEMLERLRLIYSFSGFPIVSYRRAETFPAVDPVFRRYLKLRELTPPRFRFAAPPICGEAGWEIDQGLFNLDVAIAQERLQFMLFSGLFEWLEKPPVSGAHPPRAPTVMEIGAGCGLFALAFTRAVPRSRYFICDVPEVLAVAFAYLSLALPAQDHYFVLPNGIWSLPSGRAIPSLEEARHGIIYMPNYMMHRHAKDIALDLAINAMSLHEMRPAQIAYYCQFLRQATERSGGVYFDINAHFGHDNAKNAPHLTRNFAYSRKLGFVDLALGGTVWTNSRQTLASLESSLALSEGRPELLAAFRIDNPYDEPPVRREDLWRILNEDIGRYLGVDFETWMRERNYDFADHLDGYRQRFGFPARLPAGTAVAS